MEYDRPKQHLDSDSRSAAWQDYDANHRAADEQSPPAVLAQFGLGRAASLPALRENQLATALHTRDWATRVAVVQALGKQRSRQAIASLLTALRDEHPSVRAAAARALSLQRKRVSLQPLLNTLRDTDWHVRAAAALALGRLEARVPSGPLLALLHDNDQSVRVAALSTLGKIRGNVPLEPLITALNDPEWSVREAALLALKNIGGPSVIGALLAARVDEDMAVRETAEEILGMQSMNDAGRNPMSQNSYKTSIFNVILTVCSLLALIPITLIAVGTPVYEGAHPVNILALFIMYTVIVCINIAVRVK